MCQPASQPLPFGRPKELAPLPLEGARACEIYFGNDDLILQAPLRMHIENNLQKGNRSEWLAALFVRLCYRSSWLLLRLLSSPLWPQVADEPTSERHKKALNCHCRRLACERLSRANSALSRGPKLALAGRRVRSPLTSSCHYWLRRLRRHRAGL